MTNLAIILKIGRVQIIRLFLTSSTLEFLSFTLCFPSLGMQKFLGIFWQSDTIILMIPHYNFNLKLNPVKCVKSQVSLLLIFILMLIIFGNNYPLQTLNWSVMKMWNYTRAIGIIWSLCISWWLFVRILNLLGLLSNTARSPSQTECCYSKTYL
jgi:hypothetical protein